MTWWQIVGVVLGLVVVAGIPAWLHYRKTGKALEALQIAFDRSVAFLADQDRIDEAKSIQSIARNTITSAGDVVRTFNNKTLARTRDRAKAEAFDVSAVLAEAERRRAAREGTGEPPG